VNVESQTEHKFDHSGLHSESKPFLVPEVKVGDEAKEEEEGSARATEVVNCGANSVETLLPTLLQLLITHNHSYNESL